jgi:hypothetical protein
MPLSNQSMKRTAGRRQDLISMTSTLSPEATLAPAWTSSTFPAALVRLASSRSRTPAVKLLHNDSGRSDSMMEGKVVLSLGRMSKPKQERNPSDEVCRYRLSQALQCGVRDR